MPQARRLRHGRRGFRVWLMLGYVIHDERGDASVRMAALAAALSVEGWRLAGAVQVDLDHGADCACEMTLEVLGAGVAPIRISQSLGLGSSGCRLDSGALEQAAGLADRILAERVLEGSADLVIVNKFGKQEAAGRGFRALIGAALAQGVPVLTAVPPEYLAAFEGFAGDYALRLDWDAAMEWCRAQRVAA